MSGITIYHPSKYLGGTEILFSRIIDLLIAQGHLNISVVDFNDGILSSKFRNSAVKYYDVKNFDRNILFENTNVISSARNIARVLYECKRYGVIKIKPMFWLLHPSELYSGYCIGTSVLKRIGYSYLRLFINIFPGFKIYKKIIQQLDVNSSLWIMDGACRNESEWALNYNFRNDVILPLITNLDQHILSYERGNIRKIAILSRLDDFKIHGIVKLLDDVIAYNILNPSAKITVSVIGDGSGKGMLEKKYNQKLNLNFLGYVNADKLTDLFELEQFSALFAMGTSTLEGCSRGIPTILLPSTDEPIVNRDNIYRYMHLSEGFDLGEYLNTPFESKGYMNFKEVIDYFEKNVSEISEKSSLFFERGYRKDVTQEKLLDVIMGLKSISIDNVMMSKSFLIYTRLLSSKRLHSGV
ncbi:MAG: hypothetical protein RR299_03490 [Citrobacter sp.]|uniref:Glycosyltransferase n=1 Tax=Citrobacter tructae TaxID=2562449 RepID=A0ABX5T1C1_9ENTR|nr:hypothetical protein [Citrobacter tructae]QBX79311.1 hypothetical protein E4Z61_02580 [Citrobacter tructae]